MRVAIPVVVVVALVAGVVVFFRVPASAPAATVAPVAAPAPSTPVEPAAPAAPAVVAPEPAKPAESPPEPAPARPAPVVVTTKGKPRAASSAPRGAQFAPVLAQWFSPEVMPQAQALVADLCQQESVMTREAMEHNEADADQGKKWDEEGELSAIHTLVDVRREVRAKLAALSSTFDGKAWRELTHTEAYKADCQNAADFEVGGK